MRAKPDNCDPIAQVSSKLSRFSALAAQLESKNSASFTAVFKPDNSIGEEIEGTRTFFNQLLFSVSPVDEDLARPRDGSVYQTNGTNRSRTFRVYSV